MTRAWVGLCVAVVAGGVDGSALAADVPAGGAAASRTVVVLVPRASDDITAEATARVEGELGAAGFHVVVAPFDGGDPQHEIETAGGDSAPMAAFAIVGHRSDAGGATAEIRVSDRIRQTTLVQRARLTETDHPRESAILAVRAVELLKASLAELWLQPPAPPPVVAAPPPPLAPPPEVHAAPLPKSDGESRRAPFAAGIGIGAGVGLVDGFQSLGALWLPALWLSYGWSNGWSVDVAFHGLGPAATLNARAGSASVEEQFGTVDVVKTFWPRWPVVPLASVGAGVEHVHASGDADSPYKGVAVDDWSLVTSAGLGAAVPVHTGLSIVVESRGIVAWPPTAVRIGGVDAGRVGGPSLLVDAHVLGVFP